MKAKSIYFDVRLGGITLNPVIAVVNFLMLSYLVIENVIPFWLFVPLFLSGVFILYAFVGNKFRKIQYETDSNLIYEKQTENAKTNLEIFYMLKSIANKTDTPLTVSFQKRIHYLEEIGAGKR
jgi:hypothetical protein